MSDHDAGPRSYQIPPEMFALTQVDDAGLLFISPVIHDWNIVSRRAGALFNERFAAWLESLE